jgi:hypothetical protein
MARTLSFVVLREGKWKIKLGNKHYGRYKSQTAAIRAALEAANQDGVKGSDAQVTRPRSMLPCAATSSGAPASATASPIAPTMRSGGVINAPRRSMTEARPVRSVTPTDTGQPAPCSDSSAPPRPLPASIGPSQSRGYQR